MHFRIADCFISWKTSKLSRAALRIFQCGSDLRAYTTCTWSSASTSVKPGRKCSALTSIQPSRANVTMASLPRSAAARNTEATTSACRSNASARPSGEAPLPPPPSKPAPAQPRKMSLPWAVASTAGAATAAAAPAPNSAARRGRERSAKQGAGSVQESRGSSLMNVVGHSVSSQSKMIKVSSGKLQQWRCDKTVAAVDRSEVASSSFSSLHASPPPPAPAPEQAAPSRPPPPLEAAVVQCGECPSEATSEAACDAGAVTARKSKAGGGDATSWSWSWAESRKSEGGAVHLLSATRSTQGSEHWRANREEGGVESAIERDNNSDMRPSSRMSCARWRLRSSMSPAPSVPPEVEPLGSQGGATAASTSAPPPRPSPLPPALHNPSEGGRALQSGRERKGPSVGGAVGTCTSGPWAPAQAMAALSVGKSRDRSTRRSPARPPTLTAPSIVCNSLGSPVSVCSSEGLRRPNREGGLPWQDAAPPVASSASNNGLGGTRREHCRGAVQLGRGARAEGADGADAAFRPILCCLRNCKRTKELKVRRPTIA
mmetsp:Transcript_68029/g.221460  ORF Transcript_68029/g.221460 Transcript_68029/m.221460 type:complete len:545 (-) Transcript_68029:421-2055(-)